MKKMKGLEKEIKYENSTEFSKVAGFLILMTYIYVFPTIFIIVILLLNVIGYSILVIIYHKLANAAIRTEIKRSKTYIGIFENIYVGKYNLNNDLKETVNFLAKSKELMKPIREKKEYSKIVTIQNFLLGVGITLNSHASRQLEITNQFTRDLLQQYRKKNYV